MLQVPQGKGVTEKGTETMARTLRGMLGLAIVAALVLLGAATTGVADVIPYTLTESYADAFVQWWNNQIHENDTDFDWQSEAAPPVAAATSFVSPDGYYNVSSSAGVPSEQYMKSDAGAHTTEYAYNTSAATDTYRYVEFIATTDTQARVAFDWALDAYAVNRLSEFGWYPDQDAEASWSVEVKDLATYILIYSTGLEVNVDIGNLGAEEEHATDAGRFDEVLPATFVPGQRYGLTIRTYADAWSTSNGDATAWAEISGLTIEATPEPATLALVALGGLGVLLRRKRK